MYVRGQVCSRPMSQHFASLPGDPSRFQSSPPLSIPFPTLISHSCTAQHPQLWLVYGMNAAASAPSASRIADRIHV